MSREVRKVPADWEHPTDDNGDYIPIHDSGYLRALSEWEEGEAKWAEGLEEDWGAGTDGEKAWRAKGEGQDGTFEDWWGEMPEEYQYMPEWSDDERTHWMMYESVSEGTPISPPCASPELLARWLADSGASAGPDMTATYGQWLAMIGVGHSVGTMVIQGGLVTSGVAAAAGYTPDTFSA